MSEATMAMSISMATRTGTGTAYGTFGELLQGALPEADSDFLVTLPIARWTTATFTPVPYHSEVVVEPPGKTKARRLAELMLARNGWSVGGVLNIDSELPEGKGMASSSADLVATARAVAEAMGTKAEPEDVESLLRDIEPSDGVMYPGVVAFHHRRVRLCQRLGMLPPMTIVGLDEGGTVDTIDFNRIPKSFTEQVRDEYRRLLHRIGTAIPAGDLATVGQVATRSAVLNQRLRHKRTLGDMIRACDRIGGLGVAVAHSGTAVGILLADGDPTYHRKVDRAKQACSDLSDIVWVEHALHFEQ